MIFVGQPLAGLVGTRMGGYERMVSKNLDSPDGRADKELFSQQTIRR